MISVRGRPKITIIGDDNSGKTTLARFICNRHVSRENIPTVWNAFDTTVICADGSEIAVTVVDTDAEYDYDNVRPRLYADTQAFIVCMAAHQESFRRVRCWIDQARKIVPNACFFVFVTKIDTQLQWLDFTPDSYGTAARRERDGLARQAGACGCFEVSVACDRVGARRMFNEAVERSSRQLRSAPTRIASLLRRPIDRQHMHAFLRPRWPGVAPMPDTLRFDWQTLVESGALSDVTLVAGDEQFHAHRLFLCMASPFWRRVFCGDKARSARKIKSIEQTLLHWTVTFENDVTPSMVRVMMHFALLGSLPPFTDDNFARKIAKLFHLDELDVENPTAGRDRHLAMCRSWLAEKNDQLDQLADVVLEVSNDDDDNDDNASSSSADTSAIVQFKAHRALLHARSTFFANLFQGRFADGRPRDQDKLVHTRITDIDAALLELLIAHSRGKPLAPSTERDTCLALIAVANQFGMPALMAECESHVAQSLFPIEQRSSFDWACQGDTVIDVLLHAEVHRAKQLVVFASHAISIDLDVVRSRCKLAWQRLCAVAPELANSIEEKCRKLNEGNTT
jgi:small GTP-binding protein